MLNTTASMEGEPHGYDFKPLNTIASNMLCVDCNMILLDAVQTVNGDRLCMPCYQWALNREDHLTRISDISIERQSDSASNCISEDEDAKKKKKTKTKTDGEDTRHRAKAWKHRTPLLDIAIRKRINAVMVYCLNAKSGCPYTGPLSDCLHHCSTKCEFVPVACKYSHVGCKYVGVKHSVIKHQDDLCDHRISECRYCMEKLSVAVLTTTHKVKCLDRPSQCLQCDDSVTERTRSEHDKYYCKLHMWFCIRQRESRQSQLPARAPL